MFPNVSTLHTTHFFTFFSMKCFETDVKQYSFPRQFEICARLGPVPSHSHQKGPSFEIQNSQQIAFLSPRSSRIVFAGNIKKIFFPFALIFHDFVITLFPHRNSSTVYHWIITVTQLSDEVCDASHESD